MWKYNNPAEGIKKMVCITVRLYIIRRQKGQPVLRLDIIIEDELAIFYYDLRMTWPRPNTHTQLPVDRHCAVNTRRQRLACRVKQTDWRSVTQTAAAAAAAAAAELVVIILRTWSPETVNGSLASASSLSPSTAAWLTVTLSVCLDHCFPLLLLTSSCFRFLSLVYTLDFTLINLLTCSLWSAWCIQFLAYYSTRMQSHCNIHFFHQRILDILHLFKLN